MIEKQSERINLQDLECIVCGAKNVKLWRYFNHTLNQQVLYCFKCGCKLTNTKPTPTEDGKAMYSGVVAHWYKEPGTESFCAFIPEQFTPPEGSEIKQEKEQTDTIGFLIPAIPTEKNNVFWSYSSIKEEDRILWQNLPFFEA